MSTSDAWGKVFTGILSLCCVTVTILSVKQRFFRPTAPLPARPVESAQGRPIPSGEQVSFVGPRIGGENAPLHIVEFADFECPFCAVSSGELEDLLKQYPGRVTITYKHLLIPGHVHSRTAALAAECAAEQGAFEAFYHQVFNNRNKLGSRTWAKLAKAANVRDLVSFDECVASERYAGRIVEDSIIAARLGISATPTWIVGDSLFGGAPSMQQLEEWVKRSGE